MTLNAEAESMIEPGMFGACPVYDGVLIFLIVKLTCRVGSFGTISSESVIHDHRDHDGASSMKPTENSLVPSTGREFWYIKMYYKSI